MFSKSVALVSVMLCLGGCASHDYQTVNLLGSATAHNIALQSVRDVDTPNPLEVEGGEGGSPARAVSALRNSSSERAAPSVESE